MSQTETADDTPTGTEQELMAALTQVPCVDNAHFSDYSGRVLVRVLESETVSQEVYDLITEFGYEVADELDFGDSWPHWTTLKLEQQ